MDEFVRDCGMFSMLIRQGVMHQDKMLLWGYVASRENVTEKFSKVWRFSGQSDGEIQRD